VSGDGDDLSSDESEFLCKRLKVRQRMNVAVDYEAPNAFYRVEVGETIPWRKNDR
jgi:hypothetical protein